MGSSSKVEMEQLLGEWVELHTETQDELSSAHKGCLKEALQLFMKRSFKDEDQKYQAALMERMKEVYEKKCAENEEMSRKHCAALLQLEQVMNMDLVESYMKPQRFKDHLNNLVKLYRNKPAKGVKAEEALEDYLREKNVMGKIILTVDKNMSEQQRRLEEQRAQLEEEKQRAAVAREKQEALERRVNDIERARQENERQLMERMKRDQEEFLKENRELRMQLEERPSWMVLHITERYEHIEERNNCVLS